MEETTYERYCKLRNSAGYKDADIASGTGITKSTFSDWKNGRYTPKQSKLQKIADYFGVSLEYLTTGKESSDTTMKLHNDIPIEYISMAREFYRKGVDPKKIQKVWNMFEQIKEND